MRRRELMPFMYGTAIEPKITVEYQKHRERSWLQQGIKDLTWGRFEAAYYEQRGRCKNPFCQNPLFSGVDDPMACADHCHATGMFRGILCDDCNQLEGRLRIERRLRNMAETERRWFEKWSDQHLPSPFDP